MGDPLAVRRAPADDSLRLSAAQSALLLSLPVEVVGQAVRLEADIELERLEWAAGLSLNLETEAGEILLGTRLDARGGSQLVFSELRCPSTDYWGIIRAPELRERAARAASITLRFTGSGASARCQVEGLTVGLIERLPDAPVAIPPPGRYRLTLRSHAIWDASAQVVARLRSLRAEGLVLLAPERDLDPLAEARRLLADAQPERALQRLAAVAAGARGQLWRVHQLAALDELGRTAEARDALLDLLERLPQRDMAQLLRARPERWSPWLQARLGDAWLELFFAAYADALRQHPDDPALLNLLRRELAMLEDAPPPSLSALTLLVARGAAYRADEPSRARSQLEQALRMGQVLLGQAGVRRHEVTEQMVDARVHLAALAIALGREEAALEHLRLGLEISPAPELAADRYAADPELQPLRALPGWAVIEAAGAGR
ncbi:MAG: hypothetical protein H6741_01025 [Alphaproteobacteria bacterium]|nr:hypothetical protein [Alphaproteobacteria bacterium]MCB9791284.1 hypothetical protein [Alphaproteobacteria bacterium]